MLSPRALHFALLSYCLTMSAALAAASAVAGKRPPQAMASNEQLLLEERAAFAEAIERGECLPNEACAYFNRKFKKVMPKCQCASDGACVLVTYYHQCRGFRAQRNRLHTVANLDKFSTCPTFPLWPCTEGGTLTQANASHKPWISHCFCDILANPKVQRSIPAEEQQEWLRKIVQAVDAALLRFPEKLLTRVKEIVKEQQPPHSIAAPVAEALQIGRREPLRKLRLFKPQVIKNDRPFW